MQYCAKVIQTIRVEYCVLFFRDIAEILAMYRAFHQHTKTISRTFHISFQRFIVQATKSLQRVTLSRWIAKAKYRWWRFISGVKDASLRFIVQAIYLYSDLLFGDKNICLNENEIPQITPSLSQKGYKTIVYNDLPCRRYFRWIRSSVLY